ncbi:probable LRR receptor-like serine/threonine-protein kinase At2g16250 isoform X2 [Andrographis paniculata]|uniref:probable LRR receptor-like serine/threonine-protein kinase At2g16250 isoform X2 n=1 Tax=Andrographis paniculata TaxID=175694 RepID=UPI0021E7FE5C|nr:probable LRR receptor-like serine/threonine-protein kinase At2g16250 isoform X2 [Andrographis paniculata]
MEARSMFLLSVIYLFLNSAVSQTVNNTEWRALLDLRASLGIRARDWPRRVNPCTPWKGIDCRNDTVIGINLFGLRRTRKGKQNPRFSVDSLSKLPSLITFNASGFVLNGSIPEWLGTRLTNLHVLDLRSSAIYGSIPMSIGGQIPTELSSLHNLTRLDLSSNYLSGGIALSFTSLSRLKFLNLSRNSLSAVVPPQLGDLPQLMELDLGFNSLSGSLPEELKRMKNLRKMLVGNNKLQGPLLDGLFQNLTQLEIFDVSRNNLTGGFPNLNSFNTTGRIFNLSTNQFYGNLSSVIGNGKFQIIDLSNNYFEGSVPHGAAGVTIISSNNCFTASGQRNSEVCRKFYSDKNLSYGNDKSGEPIQPPVSENSKSRKRFSYIMIGVFGGLGFIVAVISGTVLLMRVCSRVRTDNSGGENPTMRAVPGGTDQSPKLFIDLSNLGQAFTYSQMLQATGNFSKANLIKCGHSGDLFHGILEGEHRVVIKRVDLHSSRNESVMSELDFFGKVSHPRLVPLVGHCLDDEHAKILVYKYMPNGDLSNALYRLTNPEEDLQSLDWITRLKIAIGAAEALSYLHHECIPPVAHRDIQASSILLDDKYEVRLGSFSQVCTPGANNNNHQNVISKLLHAPGTSGERDRPSGSSPITCAYDVHCFGKVLLELITGKFGISRLDDDKTKQWLDGSLPFISMHEKELVMKIVDQSLIIDDDLLEEVWAVAIVAKSCLNPKSSRRPSARQVLKALENPFKVVREETFNSGALRSASSRQAWTAAFLGSWHRSSSDSSNRSGQANRAGSRSSGANDHSSSHKRSSSDVFPEPGHDLERQDGNS